MVKIMQKSLYDPLYQIIGDEIKPYFLEEKHFGGSYHFPYYVHPLAFLEYNEDEVYQNITRFGWQPPRDTDANSTNCLLNAFANQVHKQRYGFHPYVWELANMVRNGSMERGFAINKIEAGEAQAIVNYARDRLGLGGK